MRLDDALNLLGSNRDYVILALAVLVLVEGGIIVLWARRAVQLRRELRGAGSAAESAKAAAERASAAAVSAATEPATYRAAAPKREVYSVATRETVEAPVADAPAPAPITAAPSEPVAPAVAAPVEPVAPTAAAPLEPVAPAPAAEPPAEYVSPAVEQAAAWILPEVSPAPAEATTPTTAGWSNTAVPVEPDADFAVLRETDVAPDPTTPPATNGNGHEAPAAAPEPPSLTVLDGTKTWSFPAAAQPPAIAATPPAPPTPTHFDPAFFDTNDDDLDDGPISGDVLLVEDDPTIAKLYRVLLESRGYTVRHAIDGLDGLDRANEKRPDLVLLDIMMPRMNGIAFLQALRSGAMHDVPVVVLSNFMEKQLVDDAMQLGALEYMVKAQTRPEALVGALPHWLRGERAFSY